MGFNVSKCKDLIFNFICIFNLSTKNLYILTSYYYLPVKAIKKMEITMSKSDVIEMPKDTILDGVIVSVEKTTWSKIISPDKLHKFENPDEDIIHIKYEVGFKDKHLKGEETFRYYPEPMSNSKLGQFLIKYYELKPTTKIKIIYDGDGFPSIKLK